MTNPSPLESIFFAALEKQSDGERHAFLNEACAGNGELRRQIELMLHAQAKAGSFMARPTFLGHATLDDHAPITEGPGTVIGAYKLLQQIGEGGFGVVYMAEQEKPLKRRVALKVIKAGMDTKAVIARFEAERQALAMMDHPNIARVLDAGATETGRPYFVMELVKGIPITDYCDQANLAMRERLALFMDVCRAVQHAHQKGVIHRDLKPSNIMITLHDAKPVVKVIDFGIAKATDHNLTEKTLFTNYGQMIGTPVYMSPEQAVMSGLDVDTRSDVYSLGVLLYELLTGSPPFDAHTLRKAGFDEMRRIIREQQPQKPSTKLSTLAADEKLTVASQRQVSPQVLSRQLHGDLDWIVLKAIEKDRARRYESASAFAHDIERHLNSEPVMAAAPSAGYKLRKFVQRNKGPMAAAAAIVLLLLAGTTVSTWQAIRATSAKGIALAAVAEKDKALLAEAEQHRQAEISREKAIDAATEAQSANQKAQKRLSQIEKANGILGSIFENLNPQEIAKNDRPLQVIMVEKLDKAVEQLEGESIGDPLVVAGMQQKFGASLLGLGEFRKSIVLLQKAYATYQNLLGRDNPRTIMAMNHLAIGYRFMERPDLALPLLEEARKLWKVSDGTADEATINGMSNLAQLYMDSGKRELAMPLFEEALKLSNATLGPDDMGTLTITNNLALAYLHNGEAERALPLFDQTVKLARSKFGPSNPHTLTCINNLAGAYQAVGQFALAVTLYEETVRLEKITLGVNHLDTLTTMNNLAGAYAQDGRLELALPLNEETLKLLTAKVGPEHPHTVFCMDNLATAYLATGDLDRALPLFEKTLKLEKVIFGSDDPTTLTTMCNLATAYGNTGRWDLAVPLFEESLKLRRTRLGAANPATLASMDKLAAAYWKQKQFDKSIPLYEEELKHLEKKFGRDDEHTMAVVGCLGQNYKDAGRIAQAVPLLEESYRASGKYPLLRRFNPTLVEAYVLQGKNEQAAALSNEVLAEGREASPQNNLLRAGELIFHSRALLEKKNYAQAETLLRECLAIREKAQPEEWTTFNTRSMLGAALLGQKKYTDAEPLLLAGYKGMKKVESQIFAPARNRLTEALDRLIALYESRGGEGDAEKAAQYRKALELRLPSTRESPNSIK